MTVAAFALVLLSASYVWLRRWRLSRSHLLRSDGHALYFIVVAAALPAAFWTGSVLMAGAHLLGEPMLPHRIAQSLLGSLVDSGSKGPGLVLFGLIAIAAVPASLIHAWLLNLPIPFRSGLTARLLLRMSSIEELERFLWDTNERSLSVMITTTSGKVYVGNSLELPTGGKESRFVRLEPLLSGFRDSRQEFVPTTTYQWIATLPRNADSDRDALCKRDFDILIPSLTIASVHSFDLDTYVRRYVIKKQKQHEDVDDGVLCAETEEQGDPLDELTHDSIPGAPLKNQNTRAEFIYLLYCLAILIAPIFLALEQILLTILIVCIGVMCGAATYLASYEGASGAIEVALIARVKAWGIKLRDWVELS